MWMHNDNKTEGFNYGPGGVTHWQVVGNNVILFGMPNAFFDGLNPAEFETVIETVVHTNSEKKDIFVNQLIDILGSKPIVTPA